MTKTTAGPAALVDGWEARRDRLVARREKLGLTQVGLAEAAGITQSLVSLIERGRRRAGDVRLRERLAKALRLSRPKLDLLLDGPAEKGAARA